MLITNKVSIAEIHKDKQDDEVGRINAPFIGNDEKLLRITGLHQRPGKIAATKGQRQGRTQVFGAWPPDLYLVLFPVRPRRPAPFDATVSSVTLSHVPEIIAQQSLTSMSCA